jgi:trk system potassium uptake protein
MNWRYIVNIAGILILFLGLAMLPAILTGLLYKDGSYLSFIKALIIIESSGALFYYFSKGEKIDHLNSKEGMAIVTLCWIFICFFGSLPFYFAGIFETFTDAFFESVSGFTTTGASVLTNIEIIPNGLLFWRSFIQWLGGMGIILLSVAILPFLGVGGMQLYKAEVPSPIPDKLKPRIKDTAMILWKVYLFFTFLEVVFLMLGNMSFFDALCHAFTTMPTGGFSIKNASIAHYNSLYIDFVIILFMFLAGINFSLYFQVMSGRPIAFWRDSECRFYIALTIIITLIVSFNVYSSVYENIIEALRKGAFQVTSILTTTGYATADYEKWPAMSQIILLFLMFLGGCAGSTGGGMKCLRIMLCFKYCYKELFSLIHPRAVTQIKISGVSVSEDIIRSVLGFLALYISLFVVCTILMASLVVDFMTSLSSVASAIGNVGPGLGAVGPVDNYAGIPMLGKWLLIWCMLLGRLEIYTVIIFLMPEFWRK